MTRISRSRSAPAAALRTSAAISIVFLCSLAHAQQAPLGQVDLEGSSGGDGTRGDSTIPLALPEARHGLPVPVSIVFTGGSQVGQAGAGWGVPLSSISQNPTFSRQRPRQQLTDGPPALAPADDPVLGRAQMNLLGSASTLVATGAPGVFRGLTDPRLEATKSGDAWLVRDGSGLSYRFAKLPGVGDPGLWHLIEISSSHDAQSRVLLDYQSSATEIRLSAVRYNFDPTGTCAKHEVRLQYAPPTTPNPLAYSIVNGRLRIVTQLLQSVAVTALGSGCSSVRQTLSTVRLLYAPDIDTTQPRLVAANLYGREGTEEAATPVPLKRFRYGRTSAYGFNFGDPTQNQRSFLYGERMSVRMPAGVVSLGNVEGPVSRNFVTRSALLDMNGDGLPDYTTASQWFKNRGDGNFDVAMSLFPGGVSPPSELAREDVWRNLLPYPRGTDQTEFEDTWSMMIDLDGDGRVDLIDADAVDGKWRVRLNTRTGWRIVDVDITSTVAHLKERRMAIGKRFSLSRSATGAVATIHNCARSTNLVDWTPCVVPTQVELHGEATHVLWSLRDINGDGYPDLVASGAPVLEQKTTPTATCSQLIVESSPGTWERDCTEEWAPASFHPADPFDTKPLLVFYNRMGARLGSGALFADPVALRGSEGSVEVYGQLGRRIGKDQSIVEGGMRFFGLTQPTGSGQSVGLVDLNGDGLLDRVSGSQVALGTGVGFVAAPALALQPGQLMRQTESDRYDVCLADNATGGRFTERVVSAVVDLNGDGVPDLLSNGTVSVGTGSGFAPPIPILSSDRIVISESTGTCNNWHRDVVAGLFDLDGDGRLDMLRVLDDKLRVTSLYEIDAGWGALANGRITEIDNGYGATGHFRYSSLKHFGMSGHDLPFPEIAGTSAWVTRSAGGEGPDIGVTRTAYRGGRMLFNAVADRWEFRGYDRVVTVQSNPDASASGSSGASASGSTATPLFRGKIVVQDAWRPDELPAGKQRNLLSGRTHRVYALGGVLAADPANYLEQDLEANPAWRSQVNTSYNYATQTLSGHLNDADDCLGLAQPDEDPTLYWSDDDAEPRCQQLVSTYTSATTTRRGKGSPTITQDDFVESATSVLGADSYGRPTLVYFAGDTHRSDDDLCKEILYANPLTADRVLSAVAATRLFVGVDGRCLQSSSAPLHSGWVRYDGLPEGAVGVGRVTSVVVDRRDSSGALLDQYVGATVAYGPEGQVRTVLRENGQGLAHKSVYADYDPFGLVPSRAEISATDVTRSFLKTTTFDPYSLDPIDGTDTNGLTNHRRYDGYGRPVLLWHTDPVSGKDYVDAAVRFYGETRAGTVAPANATVAFDDAIDPRGQGVLARLFERSVPLADFKAQAESLGREETWTIRWFDYLGRDRFTESLLGDDYGQKRIVSGETTRDGRGQTTFVAAPYVAGTPGPHYGTAILRDDAGDGECFISTQPTQFIIPTTSVLEGRYARCGETRYDQFQAIQISNTSGDMDPTSPQFGSYSDAHVDALGRVRLHRRISGGVLDRVETDYDRLGRASQKRRFANPNGGAPLTWTAELDSRGAIVRYVEPGVAPQNLVYDRSGSLTEQWWMDGAVRRSLRRSYDGFGRLTKSSATENGIELVSSRATFGYDGSSGQAFHRDTDFAFGRLTHAHTMYQSTYLGYDAYGNGTFAAWVDPAGNYVEQTARFHQNGSVESQELFAQETKERDVVRYEYDSAQRLRRMWLSDSESTAESPLFEAREVDPFGRTREAVYGNGTVEEHRYRDALLDELLEHRINSGTGKKVTSFVYDGDLRLASQVESSTWTGKTESSSYAYDAAGRLKSARTTAGTSVVIDDRYAYDGLGNLTSVADGVGTRSISTVADATDPDRLCRVDGAGYPLTAGCSYRYDAKGNTIEAPIGAGNEIRYSTYDTAGRTTQVRSNASSVSYGYDPFGGVATVAVTGPSAYVATRFGGAVQRVSGEGGAIRYERNFAIGGAVLSKRGSGPAAPVAYQHSDGRATRVVLDGAGAHMQGVDYYPYGATRSDSGVSSQPGYTREQWNGGEHYAALGLNQLGARMYDARIGRFLSRDPIIHGGLSSMGNPYSFAFGDPVNRTDPSGLSPEIGGSGDGFPAHGCNLDGCIVDLAALGIECVKAIGDLLEGLAGGRHHAATGQWPHWPQFRPNRLLLKYGDAPDPVNALLCFEMGSQAACDAWTNPEQSTAYKVLVGVDRANPVKGLYHVASHPIETAKGIAHVVIVLDRASHGDPEALEELGNMAEALWDHCMGSLSGGVECGIHAFTLAAGSVSSFSKTAAVTELGEARMAAAAGEAGEAGLAARGGSAASEAGQVVHLPKSLGAAAKEIPVRGGGRLVSGKITGVEAFFEGRGIREVGRLVEQYGGKAANWKKMKGFADVERTNGLIGRAEVHWYECHGVGKVEFKVKAWLD